MPKALCKWICAVFFLCVWSATAQTLDPATRALIEKMQQRIDSLEKRLGDLEQRTPGAPIAAAPAAPPALAPAPTHAHDQAPVAVAAPEDLTHPTYPSLK